jgi:hypothetical protein
MNGIEADLVAHDPLASVHRRQHGEVLSLLEEETGHILVAGEHSRRLRGQESTRLGADRPAAS